MTDDPPDSRRGRILEAVAISLLTAAGTHVLDVVAERFKKRKRKAKGEAARKK